MPARTGGHVLVGGGGAGSPNRLDQTPSGESFVVIWGHAETNAIRIEREA